MPPPLLFDITTIDLDRVLIDIEGIRKVNPQRFEMEQLTAIVYLDPVDRLSIGYKDVTPEEFWVRGHMPHDPLMPGVLMCEAAAQLASYLAITLGLLSDDFLGFGGIDAMKFRGPVRVGNRLLILARVAEHRPNRRAVFHTQGLVGDRMVFHGTIIGVPLSHPASKARD